MKYKIIKVTEKMKLKILNVCSFKWLYILKIFKFSIPIKFEISYLSVNLNVKVKCIFKIVCFLYDGKNSF